jgi:hypothetical protein
LLRIAREYSSVSRPVLSQCCLALASAILRGGREPSAALPEVMLLLLLLLFQRSRNTLVCAVVAAAELFSD